MGAGIGDLGRKANAAFDSAAMILTCLECATRYFVQDETLGPTGRTVRCTQCGAVWEASPEAPLELVRDEEEGAIARAPYDLDIEPVSPAQLSGDELPKVFRERVRTRQRTRRAAAAGAVWGLGAAGFVALLGTAAVFRVDVVQAWPKAASAYAAVGLPVNATGLVIEREQADLEFTEGRPALVVRGSIRNVRDGPVRSPPLKVSLLNKDGRAVKTQIAEPDAPMIPAGSARYFAVDVLDPPSTVTEVEVRFLLDRRPPKAEPAKRASGLRPVRSEASAPEAVALETASPHALKGPAHQ
jgi:predicted Zn finger-like uncharacterized protein